jgi:hypothetical protein
MAETVQMVISLLGKDADTLLADFDAANITYIRRPPSVGVIVNAIPEILITTFIPTVGAVMIKWVKAKASRKIQITTKNNNIIHVEGTGYDADEFFQALSEAKMICVFDNTKPTSKKH